MEDSISKIFFFPGLINKADILCSRKAVNNYSLKWRQIVEYILRGEYFSLGTNTEGNNCFGIFPVSEEIWRVSF